LAIEHPMRCIMPRGHKSLEPDGRRARPPHGGSKLPPFGGQGALSLKFKRGLEQVPLLPLAGGYHRYFSLLESTGKERTMMQTS
jgi:hypothetical protein